MTVVLRGTEYQKNIGRSEKSSDPASSALSQSHVNRGNHHILDAFFEHDTKGRLHAGWKISDGEVPGCVRPCFAEIAGATDQMDCDVRKGIDGALAVQAA
jgi:hypothetical protein